jgi:sulfite exporter TauE/SafE
VLFDRPVGWRGYALGVALGFIPCGLLYGALAAAAGSGSALAGALAMIAFALGTVPALFAVALAGHVVGERWRGTLGRATAALMLVNAAQLTYLAWRTVT